MAKQTSAPSDTSFSSLLLAPALVTQLAQLGMTQMTPIQASAVPLILAGKDVVGKAKTGSGKTAAFALGILHHLNIDQYRVQALVMCPTRELAEQVAEDIRALGKPLANMKVLTLCGGTPMGPQISSLAHGAHIVVGTPGRLLAHLQKGRLDFRYLRQLVLDEADRMLDMGFEKEMEAIVRALPQDRQTLLFSATFPEAIRQVSVHIQRNPADVSVDDAPDHSHIEQIWFNVEEAQRGHVVAAAITEYQPQSCIVFCNTKKAVQALVEELADKGFAAQALHGDLEQAERTRVLAQFSNGSSNVLVATDVAARGLDIDDLALVINYQVAFEHDTHTHRIGRTGRAGRSGTAITLCSEAERGLANAIEAFSEQSLRWKGFQALRFHANRIVVPQYQTVAIDGGKKAKLRAGDILGALSKDADIPAEDIGKIQVTATHTYLGVKIRSVKRAVKHINEGKIKGRRFKARKLR